MIYFFGVSYIRAPKTTNYKQYQDIQATILAGDK